MVKEQYSHRGWRYRCVRKYQSSVAGRTTLLCYSLYARGGKRASKPLRDDIQRALKHGICAICGLQMEMDRFTMELSPSLDKIDPRKGYTRRNTQVVHFECNRMKGRLPLHIVKPHIRSIMRKAYGHLSKGKAGRTGPVAARPARKKEKSKEAQGFDQRVTQS